MLAVVFLIGQGRYRRAGHDQSQQRESRQELTRRQQANPRTPASSCKDFLGNAAENHARLQARAWKYFQLMAKPQVNGLVGILAHAQILRRAWIAPEKACMTASLCMDSPSAWCPCVDRRRGILALALALVSRSSKRSHDAEFVLSACVRAACVRATPQQLIAHVTNADIVAGSRLADTCRNGIFGS